MKYEQKILEKSTRRNENKEPDNLITYQALLIYSVSFLSRGAKERDNRSGKHKSQDIFQSRSSKLLPPGTFFAAKSNTTFRIAAIRFHEFIAPAICTLKLVVERCLPFDRP